MKWVKGAHEVCSFKTSRYFHGISRETSREVLNTSRFDGGRGGCGRRPGQVGLGSVGWVWPGVGVGGTSDFAQDTCAIRPEHPTWLVSIEGGAVHGGDVSRMGLGEVHDKTM